jgi:predicted ABC-type ATPase
VKTPRFTIVAGANGAGKSTLTKRPALRFGERFGHLLDPDAVARQLNPLHPEQAALSAGREVVRRLQLYLTTGERVVYETTMSDNNRHLRLIEQAKGLGYQVVLLYLGLADVAYHHQGVRFRAASGLHNVPSEDIDRRFERSRANLPEALQAVHRAMIYDNTSRAPKLVASIGMAKVRRAQTGGWWSPLLAKLEANTY